MLVLGRKENESIIIGDNIRVTIVGRSGASIRLGIQAPSDVRIVREELARTPAPAPHGTRAGTPQRVAGEPAGGRSELTLAPLPTLLMPPQTAS
jgi:carbon storage regulator CsrA